MGLLATIKAFDTNFLKDSKFHVFALSVMIVFFVGIYGWLELVDARWAIGVMSAILASIYGKKIFDDKKAKKEIAAAQRD